MTMMFVMIMTTSDDDDDIYIMMKCMYVTKKSSLSQCASRRGLSDCLLCFILTLSSCVSSKLRAKGVKRYVEKTSKPKLY